MSPAIAFVSETHDGNSSRASSCGEDSGSEPSIPGSNPHCPSPAQLSYSPRDDGLGFSRAAAAARAWSDDSQDVASTEDEDEDRRLEAEALTQAGSQSDSAGMAKKGTKKAVKQVNDLAVATGGKENAGPVNRPTDNTQWTTNVEKWQLQDAENVLTPRGSKRSTASTSKKQPSVATTQAPRVPLKPLAPSNSSLHSRSIQNAELNAPPSVVIQMDPLMHHNRGPGMPPSTSFKSTAMRMMERSPLLKPQASIQNDPEWAFRGFDLSETTPDLKSEFFSLAELSYPVILTYVLEYLPGIVSMTLVGHMDSPKTKEYVDGVSLSAMFMNLTALAFGFGLATALDTLCSQAFGAGKPMKMGIYFQCGVLVLGFTLIPVFLLNWYTEQFLLWMGQPEEVAALAGRFSRLVLPGIPFLYAYELFKKLLQAQNVVTPMVYIAVLSNVVNVVLGVYLTWYTPLGYDGAAIARTVANVVLPVALVPLFWWNPEIMNEWWPGWKLSQAMRYLKTFLTLGIPGMFMMLLEWWAFEIMAAFVGLLPNSIVAMSVHSVLSNVSVLTFNVFLGIGVATNIRVGNYVGRNQPEHAKLASALGMVLSMLVSVGLAIVILAARNVLPMVFINDATSIALAAHAFLFLIPYQMLDSLNSVMQGVFRGVGHQKLAAVINLFGYFVVGLPFGIFLAFRCGYGVEGLWLGLTSGIGIGVALSMVKIYNANWEELADAARVRTS